MKASNLRVAPTHLWVTASFSNEQPSWTAFKKEAFNDEFGCESLHVMLNYKSFYRNVKNVQLQFYNQSSYLSLPHQHGKRCAPSTAAGQRHLGSREILF